jgi:hypothetical protein
MNRFRPADARRARALGRSNAHPARVNLPKRAASLILGDDALRPCGSGYLPTTAHHTSSSRRRRQRG